MALNSAQLIATGQLDGFRNRIINGAMAIDQRNNGSAVSIANNTLYPVDRFPIASVCDGTVSAQRSSVAPSGFTNSLLVTVTVADAAIGAAQYNMIRQAIEGLNVSDLGWGSASAQSVTLSFWVRSSVTGTFGGALQNASENRAYAFTYSISAANTWEKKTVTIPGDTTGTWATNNTLGIIVNWSLGTGSTYSSTANSWVAQTSFSAPGATALLNTLNSTFYLTGVQLEKGPVATDFDFRSYGQELGLCQRYYYQGGAEFQLANAASTSTLLRSFAEGGTGGTAAQGMWQAIPGGYQNANGWGANGQRFPVTMRATPAVTLYGDSTGAIRFQNVSSVAALDGWFTPASRLATEISRRPTGLSFATNGYNLPIFWVSCYYAASAEL